MTIPMLTVPAADEHWYVRTADGIVAHSKYTGPVPQPGKIYCSVTTVIGGGIPKPLPYLIWLGNMPSYKDAQEYTMFRAREGTNVHNTLETMAVHPTVSITRDTLTNPEWDMVWGIFRGLRALGVKDIDPAFVERILWDDDDKTAGTADLRVCIEGVWWVIDYKTSKQIKLEHKIQVMKYATMYKKMGFPVDRVCVLRSSEGKDGYEMWLGDVRDDYLEAFEHARWMFWFLNPKAGPKMKEIPTELSFSML